MSYEKANEHRSGSAFTDCYDFALGKIAAGRDDAENRALLRDAAKHLGKSMAEVEADVGKAQRSRRPNLARALALQAGLA